MSDGRDRLPVAAFMSLLGGGSEWVDRLRRPAHFIIGTPFVYPGKDTVTIRVDAGEGLVRVSEGGELLRYLESQGLDLALDTIISKTVFHALKDIPGARVGNGEVYLVTTPEDASDVLADFVQLILEVIGLRHSKYKDALIKLSHESENLEQPLWRAG